jgi:hypothetical protein
VPSHAGNRGQTSPDEIALNKIQAKRLSGLTGLPADQLQGESIATLRERLRWRINPDWFLFELVCGQVVKVDPSTGLKYPVPGATVNVQDVDCDWLWYFPPLWPWAWAFRWDFCEIETVATTVTDACGKFCVWVPRFDIDWILEWRKERICLPDLLQRPSVGDLVGQIGVIQQRFPPNPNPPDPAGILSQRTDLVTAIGAGTAYRLQALAGARTGGSLNRTLGSVLAGHAFSRSVPPPLSHDLKQLHREGQHHVVGERLGLDAARAEKLDLANYYGPFQRCHDIYFPEWLPIIDVPDIRFQVTQDIDADSDQEVIYDGAFDVSWTLPVANVELDAADFALASPSPGCGPEFPCSDTAALQMVGLMPINSGFLDSPSGFATRPNPARASGHESGTPTYPSTAPFGGTLQLYGCVHVGDAQYYRIMSQFAPGDGLSGTPVFGSAQPMREQWHMYQFIPAFVDMVQAPVNSDGWYPILDDTWNPIHLLMNWNTGAMGTYHLTLQLGKMMGGNIQHQPADDAPAVTFFIDNNYPTVVISISQWREVGGAWNPLPPVCPVIPRTPGTAVEVEVDVSVTAPHMRSVVISAGGCGGVGPAPASVDHWHVNENDNSFTNSTIYTIPAAAPAGCYGWAVNASSRAFNPCGDNDGLGLDWYYDPEYIYVTPQQSVAVVDAP